MAISAEAWKCEKESHREESSHRHSFSCTSTTSRLCFPDMSPTPYMQMISYGVHLNTPHLLLTKAFDKVWRGGLLLKILESGGSGIMYRWIRCFLHDRSARIKLDGYFSRSVKMREGVPQGGVISPTLFLLHINNITTVLPRHVSNTLHADDLVWSASEYTTSSAYKSFWQSLAWRSPAEDTWERRFWNNVQMDPMLLTRQISQNKTGWLFQQKRENARRSPTGRSHLTDTLSPAHQQHHDCASPTCLQHPTCRWSRMECIWIHHIFCLQNPRSCEQGRAVDKWLGSSDQWSEDSGHSFLPLHLQRKSRHKAWRQDTTPSRDSHFSRGKACHPTLMEATHRGHGEKKCIKKACCPVKIIWNTLGCQLQDYKNRVHGSSPTISGIWGQCLGDSSQDTHQQTGQSSEYRLEDNPSCHENHSYSWNGEDRWSWTTWGQETSQTSDPCRKDEEDARPPPALKAQRPHKKQTNK